ncbi:12677_t:CDS:2, partial [Ambispora leptoticha]
WQHRGSVHVHGIGKRSEAPDIEWEKISNNTEKMKEVVRYLNSSSYCLRTNKQTGEQFCRFRFPKELRDETVLHNENGHMELITARNDPLINSYNHLQLQGW